ncbi:hypothetical protein C0Q70_12162 [Pomacea canaliculata]|uniref:Reverse transcriptase domain-containing protein n=1 Tax=Pomacea canaliculata TaxID=400727 RepID=A0A2T7P0R3_POMCA|nr:hypothetical protein C0Q70_12162 [Pomacea canaliculata]
MLTGKKAANAVIDSYEEVSNITVPEEKKQQVHEERREFSQRQHQEDYMNKPFNMREFEEAVKTLSQKKSPGPDKVTNEMLQHLGPRAKTKLLDLFNNSWNSGHVPQIWREARHVPVHKKGKDRAKVDSYNP